MSPIILGGLVVPAVLVVVAGAAWLAVGAPWAIAVLVVGGAGIVGFHLWQLDRLARWAADKQDAPVPEGRGAWRSAWSALYRRARTRSAQQRDLAHTIERFMSVLIEHFAGAFPLWLSPVQVAILPVADRHIDLANQLAQQLRALDIRVQVDTSAESVGKKIRNAETGKMPLMLVVGDKEMESGDLTVRRRSQKDQEVMKLDEFIKGLQDQVKERK